ncbi:MAG: gliding motility-associated C-terminal domain-containing protein, partial [Bacteroidota bacterium]
SVVPSVSIAAVPSGAICVGTSVTFTATPTNGGTTPSYQWQVNGVNAGTNSSTFTSSTLNNGDVITVIMTSNASCASPSTATSNTITMTVNAIPTAAITGDTLICSGQNTTLTASGATSFIWSTSQTSSSILINPLSTTTYTVTVSSGGTCTDEASITVNVSPTPSITISNDTSITIGTSAQLYVAGGTSWSWSPPSGLSCTNCQDPIASPTETTTYFVTVTDSSNCTATDSVLVTIEMNCGEIFIPTAFSPNNDGSNDVLYVRGNCIKMLDFAIYDRWGECVFYSDDLTEGWDGAYKGKPMNTGVFVFYLNVTLYDNTSTSKQGNINLIR